MPTNDPNSYLNNLLSAKGSDGTLELEKGMLLIPFLRKAAEGRGHVAESLCLALGVTVGYLQQVESGIRSPQSIPDDFARACAEYLNMPYLAILILTGRIVGDDAEALDAFAGTNLVSAIEAVRKLAIEEVTR